LRLEAGGRGGDIAAGGEILKPGDGKSRIAADVDPFERLKIQRHIERQPVIARAAANAQADAREFGAVDVDPRCCARPARRHTQFGGVGDDGILERHDHLPNPERTALQVDERVHDELAGAVIGHLSTAVDLHHGNVPNGLKMLPIGVEAEREHRRMFQEPNFIASRRVAFVGKALHRPPSGLVGHQPEVADQRRFGHRSGACLTGLRWRASACSAR